MEPLAFGDTVTQVKSFLYVISGQAGLVQIAVIDAQSVVGQGKVGVKFDGANAERNGLGVSLFVCRFYPQSVGLEGLQRIRGGLLQRNVELLHRGEGFAYLVAKL